MNVAALADQIVTVKAAMSYLTAIETRLRDELSQAMDPGDRKTAKARGAVIGSVTLTNPDAGKLASVTSRGWTNVNGLRLDESQVDHCIGALGRWSA